MPSIFEQDPKLFLIYTNNRDVMVIETFTRKCGIYDFSYWLKSLQKNYPLYNKMFRFSSPAPAECKTWPTKDGGCCVFPFLYQGRRHDSCVFDGQLWCAITENYDIDKMGGFCAGEICFRVIL